MEIAVIYNRKSQKVINLFGVPKWGRSAPINYSLAPAFLC